MWKQTKHQETYTGTYKNMFWYITKTTLLGKPQTYSWSVGYHGMIKGDTDNFDTCRSNIIEYIDNH